MADERWLIAGLGNPGPGFAQNRHNVGFMTADVIAGRMDARFKRGSSRAQVATGRLAGLAVIVAKPMSFMNASGGPLAATSGYYKIPPGRVIVIHDELDLPFEVIRLKLGGGDNGHNGLKSVTSALRTADYYRVRIGVGRPPGRRDPADHVLTDFSAAERKELPLLIERGADAVEMLLRDGLAEAQNRFHPAVSARGTTPGPPAVPARGTTPGTPAVPARGTTPGTPAVPARGTTPGTPAVPARGTTPGTPAVPAREATPGTPAGPARTSDQEEVRGLSG